MALHLIVTEQFGEYQVGERIVDDATVKTILESGAAHHVTKVVDAYVPPPPDITNHE